MPGPARPGPAASLNRSGRKFSLSPLALEWRQDSSDRRLEGLGVDLGAINAATTPL